MTSCYRGGKISGSQQWRRRRQREWQKSSRITLSIVFDFSWDDCNTQEKLETMVKNLCKILGGKQGENDE